MPCCLRQTAPLNRRRLPLALPPYPAAAAEPDPAAREEGEAAAAELRAAPKPLEALYNDFAVPSRVSFACALGTLIAACSSRAVQRLCGALAGGSWLPVVPRWLYRGAAPGHQATERWLPAAAAAACASCPSPTPT